MACVEEWTVPGTRQRACDVDEADPGGMWWRAVVGGLQQKSCVLRSKSSVRGNCADSDGSVGAPPQQVIAFVDDMRACVNFVVVGMYGVWTR